MPRKPKTIFISYSRADHMWLKRLKIALAPLIKTHRLDPWDDDRLPPGADWQKEIDDALARANAAICLVTPNFFASDFIVKKELKVILRRRDRDHLPVIWIPISATAYKFTRLKSVQAVHNPARPLDKLTPAARHEAFVKIAEAVSTCATESGLWGILDKTDKITQDIVPGARMGIVAKRERDGIEFRDRRGGRFGRIDPPRLSRLTEAQRALIATYHSSMANAFDRWQALYPRRGTLTKVEQKSLRRARLQMCDDLDKVIKFLDRLRIHLPDHYRTVRNECQKLQQPTPLPGQRVVLRPRQRLPA